MGEHATKGRQQRRHAGSRGGISAGAGQLNSPVTDLQRAAGNRATSALLQDGGVVQRSRKKRRRNERRRRQQHAAAHPQQQQALPPGTDPSAEPQEPQTWGAWLGGLVTSGLSLFAPASAGSGDAYLAGGGEAEGATWGEFTDEHDAPVDEESLLGVPEIAITLDKGELKRDIAGAEVEGEYELKRLLDGYEGSAKFEAKVGEQFTTSWGEYKLLGGVLVGDFAVERFYGGKVETKGKASQTSEGIAARAQASAFAGLEHKGTSTIKVKVGDRELATFKGSAGYTVGAGGELKGQISFRGGRVSIGGKVGGSYGLGAVYEYKLEIDAPAVAHGLWDLAASWAGWLSAVATSLDEAFTDEDGLPMKLV